MISPWNLLAGYLLDARELVLCAPYVKADALRRILALLSWDATITCITRWLPHDILMGASDLQCRELIIAQGGQFRLHPRLHAKYYRCDEQVLIGSANLTVQGLNLAGLGNQEILCTPAPDFDSTAFERIVLQKSRELSDEEWKQWIALESLPHAHSPPIQAWNNSTVRNWRPSTRDPEHVWLQYCNQTLQIVSDDEKRLAQLDLDALAVPAGLNRTQFNTWIRTQLMASPFVTYVISLEEFDDDSRIWAQLAVQWNLHERDAVRYLETVRIWKAYFLSTNS